MHSGLEILTVPMLFRMVRATSVYGNVSNNEYELTPANEIHHMIPF